MMDPNTQIAGDLLLSQFLTEERANGRPWGALSTNYVARTTKRECEAWLAGVFDRMRQYDGEPDIESVVLNRQIALRQIADCNSILDQIPDMQLAEYFAWKKRSRRTKPSLLEVPRHAPDPRQRELFTITEGVA